MAWKNLVCIVAAALAAWGQPAAMKGTAAARAAFEEGEAALRSDDWDAAILHYHEALKLDPDYFAAHEQYSLVCTAGKNYRNEPLRKKFELGYLQSAKEHPDKAVYPYILGVFYQHTNPDLTVRYFEEAVRVDPEFAPAWQGLAFTAAGQGKLAESREYGRQAAEAWPDSARYAMLYVTSLQSGEFAPFRQAAVDYAKKFPDQAASMLALVARTAPTAQDARSVYELMHRSYLPAAAGTLEPLFQMYLREDSAKALDLAQEIAKPRLAAYAQAVGEANAMIASGRNAAALAALAAVQLPPRTDRRVLELTRAKARDTALAYSGLLAYFAAEPNDDTRAALLVLGQKLEKDAAQVDAEVFALRSKSALPGIPFPRRPQGKVFLLNFWYPMCGPCRGEFQFLQSVLEKYKDRGFQIIAVNAHPLEEDWVAPLMQGWRLGFLPVRGSEELLNAYNVTSFPSNFLYGRDGRIYYTPGPVSSADARRELELHVEALLH
ncbi:MAG TPA: thioredoxin-like domain-containing protein [Candidatus Solibacter sp.]|jgi:thiol-disulfide isomerase/thioredoxin/Tfp pilus assembly protein PilF